MGITYSDEFRIGEYTVQLQIWRNEWSRGMWVAEYSIVDKWGHRAWKHLVMARRVWSFREGYYWIVEQVKKFREEKGIEEKVNRIDDSEFIERLIEEMKKRISRRVI